MGRFDKGIGYYTTCNLNLDVSFPEDEVKCKWCPFITHYDSIDRDRCTLTSEILYSREYIGQKCPLTIKEQQSEE